MLNKLRARARARARARNDGERGAVLVAFSILLVVMMGVAALVVDVGYVTQKKRQIQNAVDAAALAGAQDLPNKTQAIATVKSYLTKDLPDGTFTWSTCTDTGKPTGWSSVSGQTDCISFDPSFTQIRVKVPQQSYKTSFARVLGVSSLSTGAAAQARVVSAGFGSIQPFALFSGFTAGLSCLKEGPSGHRIQTCDDPSSGNFNLLDITQYGNSTLNTPQRCGNSFQQNRMIDNIAIGADHDFTVYGDPPPKGWGSVEVVDGCTVAGPNTLPPRTGNDIDSFDLGIVHGASSDTSDGAGARLKRYPATWPGYPTATAMGVTLDNKPLWQFIPLGLTATVPTSCHRETFNAISSTPASTYQAGMEAALETCITDYENGTYTGVVFGADTNPTSPTGSPEVPVNQYDIQLSPRFAYVPQFFQTTPPDGSSSNLNIKSFRAIYIEDIFANCSSSCSVDFAPGPWNTSPLGASNDKATAMTAWVFPDGMLPLELRGNPSAIGQNHYVQLSK
jgi:Flp pilus assembly protein TadG